MYVLNEIKFEDPPEESLNSKLTAVFDVQNLPTFLINPGVGESVIAPTTSAFRTGFAGQLIEMSFRERDRRTSSI